MVVYTSVATSLCPPLTAPENGGIDCSMEDDGIVIEGDTCFYTCNNGFELSGSIARVCQSDGSWSGSVPTCVKGTVKLSTIMHLYKAIKHYFKGIQL